MALTVGRMRRGAVGTAAVLLAAGGATAQATDVRDFFDGPRYLQGDYGVTTTSKCVRALPHPPSVVGIDPVTRQLLVPGEVTAQSGSGVMHFTRSGKAVLKGKASELDLDRTKAGDFPSIPGLTLDCGGTYKLQPGNKMGLFVTCSVGVPANGVVFEVKPIEAEGFVGDRGRKIDLNQKGNIQIVTFNVPGVGELVSERVCTQRFTLDKLL